MTDPQAEPSDGRAITWRDWFKVSTPIVKGAAGGLLAVFGLSFLPQAWQLPGLLVLIGVIMLGVLYMAWDLRQDQRRLDDLMISLEIEEIRRDQQP